MTTGSPQAKRIGKACWEAAVAMAVGDAYRADRLVMELLTLGSPGIGVRLAATGWAGIVAERIADGGPGGHYSAKVHEPDDVAEMFAAIVCAVGNADPCGALELMRDAEPEVVFATAMQLLAAAGASLAGTGRSTPGVS